MYPFQTANSPKGHLISPAPMGTWISRYPAPGTFWPSTNRKAGRMSQRGAKCPVCLRGKISCPFEVSGMSGGARSILNDHWMSLADVWLDHWSFCLYLLACSDIMALETTSHENAREVITLHVYLYGNFTCLWLRKNWTKDKGWGGCLGGYL